MFEKFSAILDFTQLRNHDSLKSFSNNAHLRGSEDSLTSFSDGAC